ncbi:ABC transporter ATP-binding protein [Streptomyces sp. BK022]|uniref:ABC transporter ATP-binding protein n=1 Tax=Streptomyces sp. BK022 TaxID=2512123 RepID=UPI00102A2CD5|nr:ABC transporter ATP-binding protein [Streptomyces sp. BK022]
MRLAFRANRKAAVALLIIMAVNAVGTSAIGLALERLVNSVTKGTLSGVILAAALGALCLALLEVGFRVQFSLRLEVSARVNVLVQEEIATAAATLTTLEHLEDPAYLDRITVLRQDSEWLADFCWTLLETVAIIVQISVAVALLALVSPPLTALLVLAFPPVLLTRRAQRIAQRAAEDAAEDARLSARLLTMSTRSDSLKEICVNNAAPALRAKAAQAWGSSTRTRARGEFRSAALNLCGFLIFTVGFLGALAYAVAEALSGHGTAGGVILVITLAGRLQAQVGHGVWLIGRLTKSMLVADRYVWLRQRLAADTRAGLPAPRKIERGVVLDGVSFRYTGGTEDVLRDVNLEIPAGSVVAVVGENGAGKTTLVKLLSKFYSPTAGSIRFDDVDLTDIDTVDWRRSMSAAYQDYARLEFLIRESVGLGEIGSINDDGAIHRALRKADSDEWVSELEHGLNTRLGTTFDGVDLSLGQWQRLALARSSMRSGPLLLVLDEPTASLDARTEHDQYERFAALAKEVGQATGAVTLLVSHRFSTVQTADLIAVVKGGEIAEFGSHHELMEANGFYSEMYRVQAQAYS